MYVRSIIWQWIQRTYNIVEKVIPKQDANKAGIAKEKSAAPIRPVVNIPTKEDMQIILKVFNNLEFENGKSVITVSSYPSLDELVNLMKKKTGYI